MINGIESKAFIDLGSSCCTIILSEVRRIGIDYSDVCVSVLKGYGGGTVSTLGSVVTRVKIDNVEASVLIYVVPDYVQTFPVLIGQSFTELPDVAIVKNGDKLIFLRTVPEINNILPD